MCTCKNEKEKVRKKNNAIINEKKITKGAKNYAQALRELKCAYTKKKIRIEESDTRGILNFRAKGMKYFGPLKTK